jgi:hypothetical protein
MLRYFFHICDGKRKDLVRDSEGALFASVSEAKKEAIRLGQDIVRHGLHRATWQIVVTDANGNCAFKVPLVEIRARRMRAWLDMVHRVVTYEPRFRSQFFTCLLITAVLAMITQAAVVTGRVKESHDNYQLASVRTEGAIINVRFTPGASLASVSNFIDAYKVSLIACRLPAGWYCLRISDSTMPREKFERIVSKMKQENIVLSAVVGHIEDVR